MQRSSRAGRRVRQRIRIGLAVTVAGLGAALMLRLSLWQWGRAREGGALLNYGYAVEWFLLAGLTLWALLRLRHAKPGEHPGHDAARRADGTVVGPPLQPGEQLQEVTWVRVRRWLRG
ncbi:MAG: hypothetical protein WD794_03875 [Mycobacteriales bacterium]